MKEAEAARGAWYLDHEARGRGLLEHLQEALAGHVTGALDRQETELPSGDRRNRERADTIVRQPVESRRDDIAHSVRKWEPCAARGLEPALGGEEPDDLGHEERVALGLLDDRAHQRVIRLAAGSELDEARHRLLVEPRQLHAHAQPPAHACAEYALQWVAAA